MLMKSNLTELSNSIKIGIDDPQCERFGSLEGTFPENNNKNKYNKQKNNNNKQETD